MKRIILLIVIVLFTGCGGVKFYRQHTCEIIGKQSNSDFRAEKFPFRIVYPYDHYGVFYIWNAPKPVEGWLDNQGRIKIQIASFYQPTLIVGSTIFRLDEEILKNGGIPYKSPYRKDDEQYKRDRELYKVLKLPLQKYPEVDVEIKRCIDTK